MINAITLEEERGRAPNLSDEQEYISAQVRHRAQRRTFQSGEFLTSLGHLASFLFPSNWIV